MEGNDKGFLKTKNTEKCQQFFFDAKERAGAGLRRAQRGMTKGFNINDSSPPSLAHVMKE